MLSLNLGSSEISCHCCNSAFIIFSVCIFTWRRQLFCLIELKLRQLFCLIELKFDSTALTSDFFRVKVTAKWFPLNYFCHSNSLTERNVEEDRLKVEFLPAETLLRALSSNNKTDTNGQSPFHPHVMVRFRLGIDRKAAPLYSMYVIASTSGLGGLLFLSLILHSLRIFHRQQDME